MSEAVTDLSGEIPLDSMRYTVLTADGRPTTWAITFNSIAHPKAEKHSEETSRRNLRKQAQLEAQQRMGKKIKPDDKTLEELKAENIEFIVSRIIGWTPILIKEVHPDTLEFSDDNVRLMLRHPRMYWLFQQIMDVLTDEKSFMPRSAMISEPTPSAPSLSQQETNTE